MTFPATPRNVTVQLFIDAAWFDITSDVYVRDLININRGRTDEASSAQPSSLSLTLNNRLGKYSPRNPMGIFKGKIGRNTRIRVQVDGDDRFNGEVSSWPGRWDTSGNDAYMPIEAAGILRRIGQGTQPVGSSLRSYYGSFTLLDYWPLTDGVGSTLGANADGTNDPFQLSALMKQTGSAVYGADNDSVLGTGLQINSSGDGLAYGSVGSSSSTSAAMDFVYKISGTGDFQARLELYDSIEWFVEFRNDGTNNDIVLTHFDPTNGSVVLTDTAALTAVTDAKTHHVRLALAVNGTAVDYTVYVDGISVLSGSRASDSLPGMKLAKFTWVPIVAGNFVILRHVACWDATFTAPPIATAAQAAAGYVGEAAGRRFERLCSQLGVPFYGSGNLDDTLAMGQQYEDYFSNQLTEIEATDRGLIFEPRATFAVGYRTRATMYNLTPQVILDMSALQLAPPFEPVEDDTGIRNDVFAQRREGSSYQVTQATGTLSVQDPPAGVGRYKDEVQVNVKTDDDLPPIAGWLLHLGTVDEARYPRITVNLANPAIANNSTLAAAILTVNIGYLIRITDAAGVFVYDDINLLVLGLSETIGPYEHTITFNCVPYSPYLVNQLDDADSRIDPGDDSTLSSGITSTATSMSVASSGFLWTTVGGDMPISIMVGGEEMSVTAISGASSPQTFTVTRSRNGVVKAHSTGAVVHFKRPGVVAL